MTTEQDPFDLCECEHYREDHDAFGCQVRAGSGGGSMKYILRDSNSARDGTGTVLTVFNVNRDTVVKSMEFRSLGINIANTARLFINNGLPNDCPANNMLCAELSLPATTFTQTDANAVNHKLDFGLLADHKLNATLQHATAAGWEVTVREPLS